MKNIKDKIQDKLNEDIGRVPTDEYNFKVDAEVDQALDTIVEFFTSNFTSIRDDEKAIKSSAMNMIAAFDNKFKGKYAQISEIIFKAYHEYYR